MTVALAATLLLTGGLAAAQTQPQKIRYVVALPSLFLVTANQTSVPTYLGYFKEEGIEIEPVAAGTGGVVAATQLVASGQQDVGSGTQSVLIARAAEGQDLGLSFFYNQIRDFHYVLAVLPDSGITDIKQLKGKTIGVSTLASEGVVTGKYFMRTAGLDPEKDATFVAIGSGAQALQAIKSGQVAAISNLESAFVPMEAMGQTFTYLPLPAGTADVFGPGFFARKDYIAANRKALVGLGRAIAKATLFVMTNPEAAVRIHWKAFPEQKPKGVSEERALKLGVRTFEVQKKGFEFRDGEPKLWGNFTAKSWAGYLDIYGLTSKISDPSHFYTNDLIAEINNFDAQKVIEQAKNFKMP
jgi:NitT/TauT family transport system substrate-binding protein